MYRTSNASYQKNKEESQTPTPQTIMVDAKKKAKKALYWDAKIYNGDTVCHNGVRRIAMHLL